MKEIIKYLNNKIVSDDDINPRLKYAVDYYEEYFRTFSNDNLTSYRYFDYISFLILYVSQKNPECLFDIEKFFETYDRTLSKMSFDDLSVMFLVAVHPLFKEINNFKSNIGFITKLGDIQKLAIIEGINSVCVTMVIAKLFLNNNFLDDINEIIRKVGFTVADARKLQADSYTVKVFSEFIASQKEEAILKSFVATNKVCADARKVLDTRYNLMLDARRKYLQEKSRAKKDNRAIEKAIGIIEENPDYMPISELKKILALPIGDEAKNKILDYSSDLNNKVESQKQDEYNAIMNSKKVVCMRILARYGIDFKSFSLDDQETLLEYADVDLDAILSFLARYQIPILGVETLLEYDANKIREINNYLQKNMLSSSFISKHLDLALKASNSFAQVSYNINLLYSLGINIINYQNNLEVLLKEIQTNLEILAFYGLKITKKTTDITFLQDAFLEAKINLLIEGAFDLKKLNILNDSLMVIYKKVVCKKLGIPYDEDYFLVTSDESLLLDTSHMVPEEILKAFANNNGYSDIPDYLKGYIASPITLNIEGIIVSQNRFRKNLANIDAANEEEAFYAIIYGAYYTLDECQILKRVVAPSIEDSLTRHKKSEE